MAAWAWIVIAVAVVALVAVGIWQGSVRRRSSRLQSRFGPEYNRTLDASDSRREAESELSAREQRRRDLDIRPLSVEARNRYLENWRAVQAQFVDDPTAAVASADTLIQSVMAERGYPVEDFDQRTADISVDHPRVVENYREGHRLALGSANGEGSTEDLRQAMRHYRRLFGELVEPAEDEPSTHEDLADERDRERAV
jgi:FtsZ-interacting cell division protein ZipA